MAATNVVSPFTPGLHCLLSRIHRRVHYLLYRNNEMGQFDFWEYRVSSSHRIHYIIIPHTSNRKASSLPVVIISLSHKNLRQKSTHRGNQPSQILMFPTDSPYKSTCSHHQHRQTLQLNIALPSYNALVFSRNREKERETYFVCDRCMCECALGWSRNNSTVHFFMCWTIIHRSGMSWEGDVYKFTQGYWCRSRHHDYGFLFSYIHPPIRRIGSCKADDCRGLPR